MSRYAFCTHTHTGHLGFEFYLWAFAGVWVLDYQPLWLFCRMLQDHDGVQPCSDSRAVCGLLYSPVSAHRRQSTSHRGSVFICVQCSSTAGVSSDGIQWPADINTDCIMHFFLIYFGGFVVEAEISRMGMIFALLMGMPLDELQETWASGWGVRPVTHFSPVPEL